MLKFTLAFEICMLCNILFIRAMRAEWTGREDLGGESHISVSKSWKLTFNKASKMLLSYVGLEKFLSSKFQKLVITRGTMPFGRHMLFFHMLDPNLDVVKGCLWSFATIIEAYIRLQVSCYMLTVTKVSTDTRRLNELGDLHPHIPLGFLRRSKNMTNWTKNGIL